MWIAANRGLGGIAMQLLRAGADPNYCGGILRAAAQGGLTDVVADLCARVDSFGNHLVDLEDADENDCSALWWATFKGRADAVKVLMDAGAGVGRDGETAPGGAGSLLQAACWGAPDALALSRREKKHMLFHKPLPY